MIINKGRGEYRGIGLVEVIWKVRTLIMKNRLRDTINLHSALHGFRKGRGKGTATMEAKLDHNLAIMVHEPLFQVLLDVKKAYNSLDRVRCMEIMRRYDLGTRLLQRY